MMNAVYDFPLKNLPSTGRRPIELLGIGALSLLMLNGCAATPTNPSAQAQYEENNDPIEPTNRAVFAGNQFIDRNALQPVARGYKASVPDGAKRGIHNFLGNLQEPSIAVNDALQGNFGRAWTTTERFTVNTVAGGVGLFDVASGWDLPGHQADFGQTLGVWGVGTGPSVQLPLFGASNVRDSVGKVVGMVTNPVSFIPLGPIFGAAKSAVGVVDGRAGLIDTTDAIEHTSLDYYATLRSLSAQHRAAMVNEGENGAATTAAVTSGVRPAVGSDAPNTMSVTISAPAP